MYVCACLCVFVCSVCASMFEYVRVCDMCVCLCVNVCVYACVCMCECVLS